MEGKESFGNDFLDLSKDAHGSTARPDGGGIGGVVGGVLPGLPAPPDGCGGVELEVVVVELEGHCHRLDYCLGGPPPGGVLLLSYWTLLLLLPGVRIAGWIGLVTCS